MFCACLIPYPVFHIFIFGKKFSLYKLKVQALSIVRISQTQVANPKPSHFNLRL